MIKTFIAFSFLILFNCSNEINYSGKIINTDNLKDINYKNKSNLVDKLGNPSFVDPITEKYFYYFAKEDKKSIFKNNIDYSYVFVFKFDNVDNIIESNVYDLKNKKDIDFIKYETDNQIVKRGLLERIFGGIGPQREIPSTP